jgi:hypothetical protein
MRDASQRGPRPSYEEMVRNLHQATPRQLEVLQQFGAKVEGYLSKSEASRMIGQMIAARENHPATAKQKAFLLNRGCWRDGLTLKEASALIGRIIWGEKR